MSINREDILRKSKLAQKQTRKAEKKQQYREVASNAASNSSSNAVQKSTSHNSSHNTSSSAVTTHITSQERKNLMNIRVVQRNLVYVIGLPAHFAAEDKLKRVECFGQYGKIIKIVVNKSHISSDRSNGTAGAYVTFAHDEDAQRTINAIDGYILDGRQIRASFGTTKYCNFFLRNLSCTNPECLYLHGMGQHVDSFTKEEMQAGKISFRESIPSNEASRSGLGFPAPEPRRSRAAKVTTPRAPAPAPASVTTSLAPVAKPQPPPRIETSSSGSENRRATTSAAAIEKLKTMNVSKNASSTTNGSTDDTTGSTIQDENDDDSLSIPLQHNPDPILYPEIALASFQSNLGKISPMAMNASGWGSTVSNQHYHSSPPNTNPVVDMPSQWMNDASDWTTSTEFSPTSNAMLNSHSATTPNSSSAFGAFGDSQPTAASSDTEPSEALANILGVQLTGALAAQAKQRKSNSRFAFANSDSDSDMSASMLGGSFLQPPPRQPMMMMQSNVVNSNSHSGSRTPNSGIAFLQQMLPNVNISYGNSPSFVGAAEQQPLPSSSWNAQPSQQSFHSGLTVGDPVIVRQGQQYPTSSSQTFSASSGNFH